MRVVGLYSRHDGGYAVIEDGVVVEHTEFERYTRIKESGGNSLKLFQDRFLKKRGLTMDDVDVWVAPMPTTSIEKQAKESYDCHELSEKNVRFYSHHLCHAAHGYFSGDCLDAISISIDNAGMETDTSALSCAIYLCKGHRMKKVFEIPSESFSLGDLWGRMTRFVFKLWSGYPRGHQAGSVMAMAALGKPDKYYEDIKLMMGPQHKAAVAAPPDMKRGVYVPPEDEVTHPYLDKYRKLAEDEQEKFHLAAALQKVTEEFLWGLVERGIQLAQAHGMKTTNLCFSGGVALNSVAMGKINSRLPKEWNIYIPPVPYDGGLNIGAAQYYYHAIHGGDRVGTTISYLGEEYNVDVVQRALDSCGEMIKWESGDMLNVATRLAEGKIISTFSGRSESGRRALGNRSILADPRSEEMKQTINDRVKHRQWYRPFAPSVLDDHGDEWFEDYFFSPYMSFVFKIKKEKLGQAAAIEHFDQTARVQSVFEEWNPWYYTLIEDFYSLTGVPMLLNTSFNDREPIVETPQDAINCFLGTDIDHLYFADYKILVSKR